MRTKGEKIICHFEMMHKYVDSRSLPHPLPTHKISLNPNDQHSLSVYTDKMGSFSRKGRGSEPCKLTLTQALQD